MRKSRIGVPAVERAFQRGRYQCHRVCLCFSIIRNYNSTLGLLPCDTQFCILNFPVLSPPQWGALDAEIKIPSDENTEPKRSLFKAWSRSVHATLTARDFFPGYFYPSVHSSEFFPKPLPIFPMLAVASTCFLCRPAE